MKLKKEVESQLIEERKSIFAVEKQVEEWEIKHGIIQPASTKVN